MYLTTPLKYIRCGLRGLAALVIECRCVWGQKVRIIALPDQERSLTISSAVWIQYANVTDRRTDRRKDGHN